MFKTLFAQSFQITKENLILVQPLLLYMLFLGIVLPKSHLSFEFSVEFIILLIAITGFSSAFLAGWFYMIHKCIKNQTNEDLSEEEKVLKSLELIKEFLPGVGGFFVNILLGLILYVIMTFGLIKVIGFIGFEHIGGFESFNPKEFFNSITPTTDTQTLLNTISDADKIKIGQWNLLILSAVSAFSYFTMFWFISIIADEKNPINALIQNLKVLFKKPLFTFVIFACYLLSCFIISLISAAGAANFLFQLLALMAQVFIMVYFLVVLFLYYEKYQ